MNKEKYNLLLEIIDLANELYQKTGVKLDENFLMTIPIGNEILKKIKMLLEDNEAPILEAMTGDYRDVHISEIRVNPLNFYAHYDEEDIYVDRMADSIKEYGQFENAVVYIDKSLDDGKTYTLLSGELRFKAIKKLFEQGIKNDLIHVKIVDKPESKSDEMIRIIRNNSIRSQSKEVLEKIVPVLEQLWQHMVKKKTAPKGRFVEWASALIGVSPRSITNHLKSSKQSNPNIRKNKSPKK